MARARKAPASGSSGRSGSSSSSSTGRSRSQTTRAKQATGRTASKAKTTTKKRTSSAQTTTKKRTSSAQASRQAATRSRSTAARATARTSSSPTKEQLVERVSSYARRLKRDELSSLVDRLESGTLRLGDLALSGEGGFGFQDDVRASVADRARRAAKGGEELLGRGTSAGRELLDKAKGAVGR